MYRAANVLWLDFVVMYLQGMIPQILNFRYVKSWVLAFHKKKLCENLHDFRRYCTFISFEFCVANAELLKWVFPFFSDITGVTENINNTTFVELDSGNVWGTTIL